MSITLTLAGLDAAALRSLSVVEVSRALDGFDALHAVLVLPDAGLDAFSGLKIGGAWSAKVDTETFKGDITRVSLRAEPGGAPTLVVEGLERLHRLRVQRMSKVGEQSPDQVAKALIALAGASADARSTQTAAEPTVLLDAPALGALKRIAAERNFTVWSDGKKVRFAPRNTPEGAAVAVQWASEVVSIDFAADLSGIPTAVKGTGVDYRKGPEVIEHEATGSDLKKLSGGKDAVALAKGGMGALPLLLAEGPSRATAAEVKERAVGELQSRAERFVQGTVRLAVLLPAAAPGRKLELKGAPWPFCGPFLISGVEHRGSPRDPGSTSIRFFSDSLPVGP